MRRRLPPEVMEQWEGYLRDKAGGLMTGHSTAALVW